MGKIMKSEETRRKMSLARKKWYKNNPEKAKEKSLKMSKTKIREGTHKGEKNSNYGTGKFYGKPYSGEAWNKNLTKENDSRVKKISEKNIGEKNPQFKGNEVGKRSLHNYIRRRKPKTEFCEKCKKNKPYDLANISGEYKRDIKDFEWLCRKCHMLSDGRMSNLKNQTLQKRKRIKL